MSDKGRLSDVSPHPCTPALKGGKQRDKRRRLFFPSCALPPGAAMPLTYCAVLEGEDSDLTLLAACFTEPDCHVARGADADGTPLWTLRSSDLVLEPNPVHRTATTDTGTAEIAFDETWDTVDAWTAARLSAMNGAARLLDPRYEPVRIALLRCEDADGTVIALRQAGPGFRLPNACRAPEAPEVQDFVRQWAALALANETVATVLAVLTARPTWTGLGLVLNAISADIGGLHNVDPWIGKDTRGRLNGSIQFARTLSEGPRHLGNIDGKWNAEQAMPLWEAHRIVWELVNQWIGSKVGRVVERRYW